MLRRSVGGLTGRAVGARPAPARRSFQLTAETINQRVKNAQYAVRGAIVLRAMQHEEALRQNKKMPFEKILYCNVGNPQQVGQKPITFIRQVLALLDDPSLMEQALPKKLFPADAVERAGAIHARAPGGTGAYSESKGLSIIREDVAKFIQERDGIPHVDPENIFLTDGASQGVSVTLQILIRGEQDGILIPIPQYPLYTATIGLLGGKYAGYYLDEEKGWGMDTNELRRALIEARSDGLNVRAMVVINPGNPTGQALNVDNMIDIVKFCEEENLVLMADEVYQANVYRNAKFTSFRKVVTDMNSQVELMSYHSVSKGVIGECGRRGGYLELHNVAKDVADEIYKMFSIGLCSNISGQATVDVMVNPPKKGEPSYPLYEQETTELFNSLERKSEKLANALNQMKNVSCTPIEGAMYAFPSIHLPEKAISEALENAIEPDAMYCIELLDATGICVIPGSGFKQKPGTYHFRTTFLPPDEEMDVVIDKLSKFNDSFMAKYA